MRTRVTTLMVNKGIADEAVKVYQESVLPVLKVQQGFKGVLLLTDLATGKSISITMWETDGDLKATEASGYYQEQLDKFTRAMTSAPVREEYEVSVQA